MCLRAPAFTDAAVGRTPLSSFPGSRALGRGLASRRAGMLGSVSESATAHEQTLASCPRERRRTPSMPSAKLAQPLPTCRGMGSTDRGVRRWAQWGGVRKAYELGVSGGGPRKVPEPLCWAACCQEAGLNRRHPGGKTAARPTLWLDGGRPHSARPGWGAVGSVLWLGWCPCFTCVRPCLPSGLFLSGPVTVIEWPCLT